MLPRWVGLGVRWSLPLFYWDRPGGSKPLNGRIVGAANYITNRPPRG